jgi:superfamily I DNA and RNA helicase
VLIDEAQDLPTEFLRLVHAATRTPKRIIWAYDELRISATRNGACRGVVSGKSFDCNTPNAAQQDIILPVCYRNTPWALTLAHALGFGIYRKEGLVQLFDELDLWEDIDIESKQDRSDLTQR